MIKHSAARIAFKGVFQHVWESFEKKTKPIL